MYKRQPLQSFLYFILPFRWRYTYVPILSTSSLELLEAPGTFMMGCHTRHLEVVEQVGSWVVWGGGAGEGGGGRRLGGGQGHERKRLLHLFI